MIAVCEAPKRVVSCRSKVLQVVVGVGGHVHSGHLCGVDQFVAPLPSEESLHDDKLAVCVLVQGENALRDYDLC
eukprot:8174655-Prorocentrum_lima.AAC.1